jgi:alkylhydroperoxidase family enzyme
MPRVAGLPADAPISAAATLSDSLAAMLAPRVARLGYLGGFFAVAARQPEALAGFVTFTEELKQALPDELAEVVALRVAHRLDNAYERSQHIVLSRKTGMSDAWVQAVLSGHADSEILTLQQAAVLRLVDALVEGVGHNASDELNAVVEECGEDLTVGLVLLASRYYAHAIAANAFGLIDPLLTAVK